MRPTPFPLALGQKFVPYVRFEKSMMLRIPLDTKKAPN